MEPITALAVAGNVAQFAGYATNLVRTAVEIRRSSEGCTQRVLHLDEVYTQLNQFNTGLVTSLNASSTSPNALDHTSAETWESLRSVARICKTDCEALLNIISQLKSSSTSKWQSFRKAVCSIRKQGMLDELENRLHNSQMTLVLQICTIASKAEQERSSNLIRLQAESKRLQVNQGSQLTNIERTLDALRLQMRKVEACKFQNRVPDAKDIGALEKQLSKLSVSQKILADEQAILASLSFESRPVRHTTIPEAHRDTFNWVFDLSPASPLYARRLGEWLRDHSGIFWISWKPGSGKSTLMKFLAGHTKTMGLLQSWNGSSPVFFGSHYLWAAGTAMQKSQEGLLRTLLYDILRQYPDLITPACRDLSSAKLRDPSGPKPSMSWTIAELHSVLYKVATLSPKSRHFCFFIDGLDEFNGDHERLCETLAELRKLPHIKLCLGSRPWNVFEEAFGESIDRKLYIQDLTRQDIMRYIRNRLSEHSRWPSFAAVQSRGDWLVQEITNRADGVFLWVYLVVKLLRAGMTNRDNFCDIQRRLESFPLELGPFFRQMLEQVEPFYHQKMSITLQMAVEADEPLHAVAYDFHEKEHDDAHYVYSLASTHSDLDRTVNYVKEQAAWRLSSRTRGLLEMNRETGTVTFLHRTVRDFLTTQEMTEFLVDKAPVGFNVPLTLLNVHTALVVTLNGDNTGEILERRGFGLYSDCKLQRIVSSILRLAKGLENTTAFSLATYRILKYLDHTLVKEKGMSPVFFREQVITSEAVGFLDYSLKQEGAKFSESMNLFTLVNDIYMIPRSDRHSAFNKWVDDTDWRGRGVIMLTSVLETKPLGLETQREIEFPGEGGSMTNVTVTPWAVLITAMTPMPNKRAQILEDRFWPMMENGVLTKLLRHGANIYDIVPWRNLSLDQFANDKAWTTLAAFIDFVFEIGSPAPNRAALFKIVLEEFLTKASSNPNQRMCLIAYDSFFQRLVKETKELDPLGDSCMGRDVSLLETVCETLLDWADRLQTMVPSTAQRAMDCVKQAFAPDISKRLLEDRFPHPMFSGRTMHANAGTGSGTRRTADSDSRGHIEKGPGTKRVKM